MLVDDDVAVNVDNVDDDDGGVNVDDDGAVNGGYKRQASLHCVISCLLVDDDVDVNVDDGGATEGWWLHPSTV